jgi:DNA-directed RNA polymerase specialized sigma subunit
MKETIEFSETRKQKTRRVDEMLNHLMRSKMLEWIDTGVVPDPMSLKEIADYCGVDEMVIYRAERSAIEKISLKCEKS